MKYCLDGGMYWGYSYNGFILNLFYFGVLLCLTFVYQILSLKLFNSLGIWEYEGMGELYMLKKASLKPLEHICVYV